MSTQYLTGVKRFLFTLVKQWRPKMLLAKDDKRTIVDWKTL